MKFSVINLGCKVNRVESDSFISSFLEKGFIQEEPGNADVILINTCTVTGEAEKKTRKAIRKALRENNHAPIIVLGCAVVIDAEGLEAINERVITLTNKAKAISKAVEVAISVPSKSQEITTGLANTCYTNKNSASKTNVTTLEKSNEISQDNAREDAISHSIKAPLRIGESFPSRVGIKIQDGCSNACTFCIVHVARGNPWSRAYKEIIDEVLQYEAQGVSEIVLTGINIGSYQCDGFDLSDLMALLIENTKYVRLRISSIEPCDVTEKFIRTLANAEGKICRHLHLPLQSGSTKVLNEMGRPYSAESFCCLVDQLYEAMPLMSLSTDIIVGFPGETNDDFEQTLQVVKHCRFSKVHVFPYSVRQGTPAAQRKDQLAPIVKSERAAQLRSLATRLRRDDFLKRCGQTEEVLVEGHALGTTESYHRIQIHDKVDIGRRTSITLSPDQFIE